MKVTKAKTGSCEYTLDVEVEAERLERPMLQAAQRISKRRPLAGFRPGKAPYAIIERLYGKDIIVDEMLDVVGNEFYSEALTDSGLEAYAPAHLKILQTDPLKLQFTVATKPEVTLGKYQSIRVKLKPTKVRKSDVDQVVKRIQEQAALWIPVERPLAVGDQIVMDAVLGSPGEKNREQKDVTLTVTHDLTPPGLAAGLEGMKAGESKELDLTYPDDYREPSLAGKSVHMSVTVKAVKEKELPPLDDELAKSQGSFATMAEMRQRIQEQLQEQGESEAREKAIDEAVDAMVDQATLEYPAAAVDREIDLLLARYSERLKQQGFTLEGYLAMTQKTLAQLRDEMRAQGERRLRRTLILAQLAEAEGISVAPEEVEAEVERISQTYGDRAEQVAEALSSEEARSSVTDDLFNRKLMERLLAIVAGALDGKPEKKKRGGRAKQAESESPSSPPSVAEPQED